MATSLYDLADAVCDELSFLKFVAALGADWEEARSIEKVAPTRPYASGALGWENGTIGAMLDSAVAWGEASKDGLPNYSVPENAWRRAAHILHAGKFYE